MAQVFISFIHEELAWAEAVQTFVNVMLGFTELPFMSSDQFQVYAGEKWLDRIMGELKAAKVVLLMLSEISVKRAWVNFEAGAAWTRNIVIIPVCYGDLRKGDLPKPYSSIQAVDLHTSGDSEYLARSIAHHLGLRNPLPRGYEIEEFQKDLSDADKEVVKRQKLAYDLLEVNISSLSRSRSRTSSGRRK